MEHSVVLLFVYLIGSLALLVFGANTFTECAEKIGKTLKLPDFVIGVLIISIGTSLPELIASIFATLQDHSTIVAGSVVGANVTNTLLVLGVAFMFFKKEYVAVELINIDIPFLLSAVALFTFITHNGNYDASDGVFLLIGTAIYIWSILTRENPVVEGQEETCDEIKEATPLTYVLLAVSGVMIYFGGDKTVECIHEVGVRFKLDAGVVAGTLVAMASTLPELLIAYKFARKGKLDVALGNVVGSSIFNYMGVVGISSLFSYFSSTPWHLKVANETITKGVPMAVAATLIFTFVAIDKRHTRFEGAMFIMLYCFYVGWLIGWL